MNRNRTAFAAAASVAGLFLIGSLVRSPGSRANGAAYSTPVSVLNTASNPVPVVVTPGHPFATQITIPSAGYPHGRADGPTGGGTLGVTSITITNFDAQAQQATIFLPAMDSPGCSGSVIGGADPQIKMFVPAGTTMHFAYPTPLVFGPCVAAQVNTAHTGGVEFDINGVVN